MRVLDQSELARLTAEVSGPVLTADDDAYPEETATWNLSLHHTPAVAVGAASVADVQAAVRFANVRDLRIAVVATGHGAVVPTDGALLINLRRMNDISIDAQARTATVGAAVQTQDLIEAAAGVGLAPLAGSSPNVGFVGYTLGGGLSSTLGRTHGFAADHVRAAEIVTSDGQLRRIDARHEPDLFWAIRGGKGNFGVVTSLTIGLVPVTRLYGGGLFYTGEHVDEVLDAYRRLLTDASDEMTTSFAFLRLPSAPFVPEPLRERFILHVRVAYLGSASEGERLIAGLRGAAPTVIDTAAEMPYTSIAAIHADPVDPLPVYEVSAQLHDFPHAAAEALVGAAGPDVETPALVVEIRQLGGALAKQPPVPNAVGCRAARFQLFAGAGGAPGMAGEFRAPLEGLALALRPWATGQKQANFLTAYDTTPEAVKDAYEPQTYDRLVRIKHAYDPRNLFRVNHNIAPR